LTRATHLFSALVIIRLVINEVGEYTKFSPFIINNCNLILPDRCKFFIKELMYYTAQFQLNYLGRSLNFIYCTNIKSSLRVLK
jgi:hypothetical protein